MLDRRTLTVAVALAATAACGGVGRTTPAATSAVAGVAAAHPLAVDAGLAVLEAGGSAVDAAVAVQAVLGLVEPQSSGLGGGAFLVHYEARTRRVRVWDGREVAPQGVDPRQFVDATGQSLPFDTAVVGGTATGVPGVVPMLGVVHAEYGRRPWASLFDDAIRLADDGFPVSRRLSRFANGRSAQMAQPDAQALLRHPQAGRLVRFGDTLRNPAYAATLRAIATRGPRALHEGPIAAAIVARLREGPRPSTITLEDLAAYQPVERTPLCGPYRALTLCVPPPPSSGVSVLQLLAMLERGEIHALGPDDPRAWLRFAEASRLMYADRDAYVADPGFVTVPVEGLLEPSYVAARAATLGERAGPVPTAGQPSGLQPPGDATVEVAGTSHFVIVDFDGNVVSMTTTVESVFGSGRVVGGFFLNNELTDFSFQPVVDGVPVANAIAPGKRPRSSMAPTIALDRDGRFVAALGSPGGSSILAYNAKLALGLFGWNLPMQVAIELPNIVARGARTTAELSRMPTAMRDSLARLGLTVQGVEGEDSGLHGLIWRGAGRLEGGADGRRDGAWRVTTRRR